MLFTSITSFIFCQLKERLSPLLLFFELPNVFQVPEANWVEHGRALLA